jgi:hypothetical protein
MKVPCAHDLEGGALVSRNTFISFSFRFSFLECFPLFVVLFFLLYHTRSATVTSLSYVCTSKATAFTGRAGAGTFLVR